MEKHILVPNKSDLVLAREVAMWTNEAGTMLPKTADQVLGLFALGRSILIVVDGLAVAHAAVTFEWPNNWLELGAVVTKKEYRNKGFARMAMTGLLKRIKDDNSDKNLFALCNQYSLHLFTKMGGK